MERLEHKHYFKEDNCEYKRSCKAHSLSVTRVTEENVLPVTCNCRLWFSVVLYRSTTPLISKYFLKNIHHLPTFYSNHLLLGKISPSRHKNISIADKAKFVLEQYSETIKEKTMYF